MPKGDWKEAQKATISSLRRIGRSGDMLGLVGADGDVETLGPELSAAGIPAPLSPASWSADSYLFAWPSVSGNARTGERQCYVPTSNPGWFFGVFHSSRSSANKAESITDTCLAKSALHIPHGSCSKTGAWTTTTNGATFKGDYAWSTSAGATLSTTVSGSVVGVLNTATTNGGYGVVAIDGDYTRANRLPSFTDNDYAAGLCRQSDIGKRYFSSYGPAQYDDHIVFADDLDAGAHVVLIEATGTKPAASSSQRCYVQHVWACDNQTVGDAGVYLVPVHYISHNTTLWSAHLPVIRWAPSGSSDYQFLGENHADGVASKEVTTDLSVFVDAGDQTALAKGSFASGSIITINHTTTLAHKSDLSTVVATKRRKYTFAANRALPLMCDVSFTWSASGAANIEYPVMLHLGRIGNSTLLMVNTEFDSANLGGFAMNFPTAHDDAIISVPTRSRAMTARGERLIAWAEVVAEIPERGQLLTDHGMRHQSRSTNDDKLYVVSAAGEQPIYTSGDVQRWIIGLGADVL